MMQQLDNELYPLVFEEVVEDSSEGNPFGLTKRQQATYETFFVSEGKSIEPVKLNFFIFANETVDQSVVADLLDAGIAVDCTITPIEDDFTEAVAEDERPDIVTNIAQAEESTQDINIDNTLVFTFEVDSEYLPILPNHYKLDFSVDPKINLGIKHLYNFSGDTGLVTVNLILTRGNVQAEIWNKSGRKIQAEISNQSELLSNPPGPIHLSIIAVGQESIYRISGTREVKHDDNPDRIDPHR
jgi:hypothetical protein